MFLFTRWSELRVVWAEDHGSSDWQRVNIRLVEDSIYGEWVIEWSAKCHAVNVMEFWLFIFLWLSIADIRQVWCRMWITYARYTLKYRPSYDLRRVTSMPSIGYFEANVTAALAVVFKEKDFWCSVIIFEQCRSITQEYHHLREVAQLASDFFCTEPRSCTFFRATFWTQS
jgi:hypothetical protein